MACPQTVLNTSEQNSSSRCGLRPNPSSCPHLTFVLSTSALRSVVHDQQHPCFLLEMWNLRPHSRLPDSEAPLKGIQKHWARTYRRQNGVARPQLETPLAAPSQLLPWAGSQRAHLMLLDHQKASLQDPVPWSWIWDPGQGHPSCICCLSLRPANFLQGPPSPSQPGTRIIRTLFKA